VRARLGATLAAARDELSPRQGLRLKLATVTAGVALKQRSYAEGLRGRLGALAAARGELGPRQGLGVVREQAQQGRAKTEHPQFVLYQLRLTKV
jgi:hypothetical protein